jgi:hypothetical protein
VGCRTSWTSRLINLVQLKATAPTIKTMFTFLGILGFIITILVALPASLIAFASLIEHPIKTTIKLWTDMVETYRNLWENITK